MSCSWSILKAMEDDSDDVVIVDVEDETMANGEVEEEKAGER